MGAFLILIRPQNGDLLSLIVDIMVGAAVYVCSLFFLWIMTGRPRGAESEIIGIVYHWASAGKSRVTSRRP